MSQGGKQMEGLLVQKKIVSVINVLREIEPLISDIRMGANNMIYIDIGKDRLFPANIMGDGIRRILAVIAAIADMKNGVLLIDEIDNGFHYTSLITLWKAIFKACKEYNVQLFATTHSYECIEAYANVYAETSPGEDDLRLFRIDRKGNQHKAYSFSAEVLKTGIEKEFEVR
jgi:AAA15 family ATPase/GTPase